jgi:hypothetical protein
LVDSSPWLFAATHVLHRHLAPRHPPLALCNLKSHTPRLFSGEKSKELTFKTLVLAMQFSRATPKPSRSRGCGTRRRGNSTRGVSPGCGLYHEVRRPFCLGRGRGDCPLPQNRAVNTRLVGSRWCQRRPGRSADRGPEATGWYAEVEIDRLAE